MLGQDQHNPIIQRKKLVERTRVDTVALIPGTAVVPAKTPESTSEMDIQNKTFDETPWSSYGLLHHYLKMMVNLNFIFNWVPVMMLVGGLATTYQKNHFQVFSLIG